MNIEEILKCEIPAGKYNHALHVLRGNVSEFILDECNEDICAAFTDLMDLSNGALEHENLQGYSIGKKVVEAKYKKTLTEIKNLRSENEILRGAFDEKQNQKDLEEMNKLMNQVEKLREVVRKQTEWISSIEIKKGEYKGYRSILTLGEQALEGLK
jgi:hypothetical protein